MLNIHTIQNLSHAETQQSISDVGIPLAMAAVGTEIRVADIRGNPEIKRFLNNLGFMERTAVTVISELGGNMIVSVKGSRMAISKAMAAQIITVK